MENINVFDIVVIALVVILGLKGLIRGFIKELFALVGIVGGIFVASRAAKDVGEIAGGFFAIDNESTVLLVGFIVSLILFWIVAYVVGSIIEKVFELSGLGVIDKLFGFIFGAGKIFLLFAIISYAVTGVNFIYDKLKPKLQDSAVFPILVDTGKFIIKLDTAKLQGEVKKRLDSGIDATNTKIQELSQEELEKKALELKKQLEETTNTK